MKVVFSLLVGALLAFGAVDINKATAKELTEIKGIGALKAEAIVAYRTANGCFENVNSLEKVKGIGKKFIENNQENLVAGSCEK
jgi:competence protein ComEA